MIRRTPIAKVVDRLLASPHYGERWGRYWLDVARYAEDQAHTFAVKPNTNAWRYRDWVINAFNEDMPYDRFVKLQIAADLLATGRAETESSTAGLGFFGLGASITRTPTPPKATADELDDRVDTLTRGLLGLTVACARCHDHKFDPIPTQDYYSLAGVFQRLRAWPTCRWPPRRQVNAKRRIPSGAQEVAEDKGKPSGGETRQRRECQRCARSLAPEIPNTPTAGSEKVRPPPRQNRTAASPGTGTLREISRKIRKPLPLEPGDEAAELPRTTRTTPWLRRSSMRNRYKCQILAQLKAK